jgi:hypothetical protein
LELGGGDFAEGGGLGLGGGDLAGGGEGLGGGDLAGGGEGGEGEVVRGDSFRLSHDPAVSRRVHSYMR